MNNFKYLSKGSLLILLIVGYSLPLYAYDCCVDGVYYNLNSSVPKKAYVAGCEDNINTIIIPETVSIDGRPYDVVSIGENAFYRCYNLKEVIFPKSLIEIGKFAFSKAGLCKVEIPNNVTTIGYGAFDKCDSLSVLLIGNQVSSIGEFAFNGCTNLKSVVIPNSVTELKSNAFGFCENLKSVTLSENLTYISEGLFYGCKNLLNISIPEKILMIEFNAFHGCESLTILEIPNNVESIGVAAFEGCEKLSTVTIGSNVKTIEDGAFLGCNISVVYALSTSAPKIAKHSFDTQTIYHYSDYGWLESTSYTINATLYVPYGCKSSYTYYSVISRDPLELSNYWHRFKKIEEREINTSGIDTIVSTDADMVVYTLIGERLTINANQIKSLPKGIYIINGKKILIQ